MSRLNLREVLRRMPKRKIKRTTVDLPEDVINVIDVCAKAIGVSRSNFLTWYFDSNIKEMIEWTDAQLNRSQIKIVKKGKTKNEQ